LPTDIHAIEAVGLSKRFGDLTAVDDVTFSVRKGEIFGFLGPNGAGKTTTVGMLTTLLTPTEGMAVVEGRDIGRDPYGVREAIGVVPETSNVYIELSAWDNLMFSGELYGVPRRERSGRARQLLETLGLWNRRDTRVLEFSRGMQRRLTIAMALVHRAKVLFLDEPTAGLDVQSSILIRDLIEGLRKEGTTVFLTTHQMDEANQMCDRVAIIDHGELMCVDAPERLRQTMEAGRSVVVSFTPDDGSLTTDLTSLQGVIESRKEGDKLRLFTKDPGALVPPVVDLVRSRDARLLSVSTLGPSLEDVFVRMTGLEVGGERRRAGDDVA